MVIGMLAVLKSGKAYVPLDPTYPLERSPQVLEDAEAEMILTNNENYKLAEMLNSLVHDTLTIVNIDSIPETCSGDDPPVEVRQDDLAYILYTSGSTGKSKGVMQNHRNVLHFIRTYTKNRQITSKDNLSLFSTYCFDASVMDIYGALLNGATLFPLKIKEIASTEEISYYLKNNRISIYHSIPKLYRLFISSLEEEDIIPYIRLVVLGGEAVFEYDVANYKKHFNDTCRFINGLGPTESTVTLQNIIDKDTKISGYRVPVGFPVDETNVYILNESGIEAPVFEVGEIVYESPYLALGYWNNTEETNKAFGINPITGTGRIYHSGDYGRYLSDGTIEFMQRKDNQIKIRGYRAELSEVDYHLDSIRELARVWLFSETTGLLHITPLPTVEMF